MSEKKTVAVDAKVAEPAAARRFRITVAYDGTNYGGWQVQPGVATVQQELERVIGGFVGHEVKVHGSGRTDQGVHARGQVAHFDAVTRMDAAAVLRACNARLPADIRVEEVDIVRSSFHARRDATRKEYRYFVWDTPVMPPERRLYAAHAKRPLELTRMRRAARFFVGEHDFAPFSANPLRPVESTVRRIHSFTVTQNGALFTFSVIGSGFLYKQVRSMVGFLLRVGCGAEEPEAVAEILREQPPRTARVPSAEAQGLFLWQVWYGRAPRAGNK